MFRKLDDQVSVAGQLGVEDVARAKAEGFAILVNNRPDGEQPGQPAGADIAAAAAAAGLAYHAIPIAGGEIRPDQVGALATILQEADGPVLAFCRSGTRSTYLWAIARRSLGDDPQQIAAAAGNAGYDLGPLRAALHRR